MILALLLATELLGSAGPAALEGVIKAKAAGSRLPGARVVVAGPYGRFETASDTIGHYLFPALPPGTGYSLRVFRDGFAPVAAALSLAVGETRKFDVEMDVQTLNQSITVMEDAPAVPERTRTVTVAELAELPSNGRSLTRFALLDPGVRQTQGLGSDGAAGARLSINANSFRHTGHTIDGLSNYDVVFANAPQQSFSVAAVEEVKVLANPYSAEYGGSSAGVVAVSSRAGTDSFHGEAFGFLRPSGIQAKPD